MLSLASFNYDLGLPCCLSVDWLKKQRKQQKQKQQKTCEYNENYVPFVAH